MSVRRVESFARWLERVEREVTSLAGVSRFDLPDANYAWMHQAGISPNAAARTVLIDAGWES
jgi:hypothetical protein